jgi:hypothetical protein
MGAGEERVAGGAQHVRRRPAGLALDRRYRAPTPAGARHATRRAASAARVRRARVHKRQNPRRPRTGRAARAIARPQTSNLGDAPEPARARAHTLRGDSGPRSSAPAARWRSALQGHQGSTFNVQERTSRGGRDCVAVGGCAAAPGRRRAAGGRGRGGTHGRQQTPVTRPACQRRPRRRRRGPREAVHPREIACRSRRGRAGGRGWPAARSLEGKGRWWASPEGLGTRWDAQGDAGRPISQIASRLSANRMLRWIRRMTDRRAGQEVDRWRTRTSPVAWRAAGLPHPPD